MLTVELFRETGVGRYRKFRQKAELKNHLASNKQNKVALSLQMVADYCLRYNPYSPNAPAGPGNTTGLSEPSSATADTPKK